jgi:hypothetical protein
MELTAPHWNLEERTKKAKAAIRTTIDLTGEDILPLSYKEAFEKVQNPAYWKEPTIPAILQNPKQAQRLVDAITFFAGGAEMEATRPGEHVQGWRVTSKGYYHYIGA